MNKRGKNRGLKEICLVIAIIFLSIAMIVFFAKNVYAADPEGPGSITIISNETKATTSAQVINISGGYIANINITATIQNPRWKAFVGNVLGSFTLADASGAQIYDWTFSTTTGRIYATRNSSFVTWSQINCSNATTLEAENSALSHTSANDNLTSTFNITNGATHSSFYVGNRQIAANRCPTLNTYIGNNTQDSDFEEMALYDGYNIVYATILENNLGGYDDTNYDFQMIVPERGDPGFTGATAYYLYIEIGT
ncbi:MAG: hypothetical protein WC867_06210 [Candidatus Pacearchaeota archaeon]|jgi:hypothetical protein